MTVRKMGVVSVVAGMALLLAACSSSAAAGGASGGSSSQPVSATLVVGQKGPAFYTNMVCGASAEAKSQNVTFSSAGAPDWAPAEQIPLINAAMANKPSVLIVVPTDTTGLNPVLQSAKASGTKIITADTTLDESSGIANAAVTSDNEGAGKQGADQLAKFMGDKGTAVAISNPPGITTSALRLKGFLEEMKSAHPNITLLPTQFNDTTAQKSATLANATLAAHPEVNGFYATDDVGTIGSGTALRNAGLTDKIFVVGTDADPGLVGQLESGEVDALVTQRPDLQGKTAVQFAVDLANGKSVPPMTLIPTIVVTRDNLNSAEAQSAIYKDKCA